MLYAFYNWLKLYFRSTTDFKPNLRVGRKVVCGGDRPSAWHTFAIRPDTTWRIFRTQYCPWRVGKCNTWLWRCKMGQDDRTMITEKSKNDDVDFWAMNPGFVPLSGRIVCKVKENPISEFSCLIKLLYLLSRSVVLGEGWLGVVFKERDPGEANGFPARQEIRCALLNPVTYYPITNRLPVVPIMSQMNPGHTLQFCLSIVSFNIILQPTTISWKCSLSFRFLH